MSNDKSTASDDLLLDLEDGDANDSSADDAERLDDSEDSEDEGSDEEESAGEDLELDSDEEEEDAEKAKRRQVANTQHAKSWAAKILVGKATIADVPESIKYLLPEIKKFAGIKEKAKPEKKPEIQKVSQRISDKEVMAIVNFQSLKKQVEKAYRTPEQNKILNEKFKSALSKGDTPEEALKYAVERADLDLEEPADMPEIRSGSGFIRKSKTEKTDYDSKDPNKMTRKELAGFVAANSGRS